MSQSFKNLSSSAISTGAADTLRPDKDDANVLDLEDLELGEGEGIDPPTSGATVLKRTIADVRSDRSRWISAGDSEVSA
jgi:hypothetical protein